ncbi:MAG TPA: dienelactone hydrolase family protein [Tepidisphaeraceae bacterium]|nr:dienelactone hydrolase family protein [Tepidisphaeraceae bacterium]
MKRFSAAALVLCITSNLLGAIKTKTIEYKQGDTTLEGYLAYDDSTIAKRPAVIVIHEWWGNNSYSHKRAEMLAQLGYVGFAIDMYGKGMQTDDAAKAGEWSGAIKKDPKTAFARIQAGMDQLKAQPMVDMTHVAAIGYCFGGSCVLNMARTNMPILGVVSFHGDLSPLDTPSQNIKPKILVCNGADDSFVPAAAVQSFEDEMRKAGADWQFINYSSAHHAFTNPDADSHKIPNISYNKAADERSWRAMKDFLTELFGK